MFTTNELQLFLYTARYGSITKAAQSLGMLTATASASLKRLERELGCRLFERSTRSIRLTAQGEAFLPQCQEALLVLDRGIAMLHEDKGRVAGLLRITAPSDVCRHVLLPWMNAFQELHPALRIHLHCSDQLIDLFHEPFDMAFRYGRFPDSSLVSQKLGQNCRIVVASPDYLRRKGTPRSLEDLPLHNCLIHNTGSMFSNVWRFTAGRKAVQIRVTGDRVSSDGAIIHAWALAGTGIAYKSALDVHGDIQSGRLVQLLPQLVGEPWPLRVVYPHRSSVSAAARALAQFIREQIATILNNR